MKDRQFDNFVITGGTISCHYDNLLCHQWWHSCQFFILFLKMFLIVIKQFIFLHSHRVDQAVDGSWDPWPDLEWLGEVVAASKGGSSQTSTVTGWSRSPCDELPDASVCTASRCSQMYRVSTDWKYPWKYGVSQQKILSYQYRDSHHKGSGPRLNIKTVLSTYGDFHVKDKTAVRTSYL